MAHTWSESFETWFSIPAKQGTRALRLLLLVFVVSVALVLMKAAQNGIFLATYPRSMIPWAFVASALTLATTSFVAMSLTEKYGSASVAKIAIGSTITVLTALRLLLLLHLRSVAFIVYVCIETACGILLIHTWSTVSSAVDTRSARKLLPIAGVGAALAWLLGGLCVKGIVKWLGGVSGLLPLSSGVLAVALGILFAITSWDVDNSAIHTRRNVGLLQGWKAGFQFVWKEPLMKIAASLSLLAMVAEQLMDLQLMCTARDRLGSASAISSFFGTFYGITSGVTLLVLLAFSSRFLKTFGTRGTLLASLLLTVGSALCVVVLPTLGTVVLLRAVDRVLKGSLWTTATEQLQLPLIPLRRTQARSVIRGVIAPLGYAVVAVLFALFPERLQVRPMALLTIVIAAMMAVVISITLQRELRRSLHRAVNSRALVLTPEIDHLHTNDENVDEKDLEHATQSVKSVAAIRLGSAIRKGIHSPLAKERVIALIRKEVAQAGVLTSILAGIAQNDGVADWEVEPEFKFLAHEIELRIEESRRQILSLLVLLGQERLAKTVEVGRRRPSRQRDAQIAELLELELDHTMSELIVPLYEPLSLRERVQVTQKLGLLDQKSLVDPMETLINFGDSHLRRSARLTYDQIPIERLRFENLARQFDREDQRLKDAQERLRKLRCFELFRDLPAEDLLPIAQISELIVYQSGETIFVKGDNGDELYLVVHGEVQITDGNIRIATAKSGEFFGDLAMIDRQPRSGTARCSLPTNVLRLHGADLDALMFTRPTIAMHFLRVVANRLRIATKRFTA